MTTPIRGVLPALITPFDERGKLDESRLRSFLRFLIPRVHGLYPCGSYGSGPLMTEAERQRVAEIVMDEVAGRVPVVLHVGTPDTPSTLRLAKHAEAIGVTAIACLTPYYYLHSFRNVAEHFKRILGEVSVPTFLYHNPKYTNLTSLTPDRIAELAELGLSGLKDSSANISFFYDCAARVDPGRFTLLIGSQTVLLPAILGGGHGCVSGLSNLLPGLVNQILELARTGRHGPALELQRKANALRKLTGEGIPVPFYHAALRLRGVDLGVPRGPHLCYSQADVERITVPIEEAIRLEESLTE